MTVDVIRIGDRVYHVDPLGFLIDWREWDEGFASGLAPDLGIPGGLTDRHWQVIRFIREHFVETGRCPVVYQACRRYGLRLNQLRELFPTGYQRGACKLAGLTFEVEPYRGDARWTEAMEELEAKRAKAYRVDAHGFLIDPADWDEQWALGKADELGMAVPLGDVHWRVLRSLREEHRATGVIPTVYATCERHGLELEELERLFPSGYHRGAVKLAGLRLGGA
jgi:tRNA 2-thiouridine synthesizing protein E